MQDILKNIIAFLQLIRYPNLAIIILTQFLTYYFIIDCYPIHYFSNQGILLLIAGSVLIAAAGNIINDVFDVDIDRINKPNKVLLDKVFSKRFAIITYSIFNLVALICGMFLNPQIFFVFIFSIMLLILYSAYFKRLLLIGNLTVSILIALSVFIVWIYRPFGNFGILLFYSAFAFLSTFIREIIKDIEDIEGDEKLQCLTFPIVYGIKFARNLILFIMLALIALIEFSLMYFYVNSFENTIITAIYLNILTILPLVFIGFKLFKASTQKDFSNLSSYLKLVMIAGIISITTLKMYWPQ